MPNILANLAGGIAATLVPLFVGLFIPYAIAKGTSRKARILMAFSSGIIFWFFLDVMNDAVLLDVNQGFRGGIAQLLLVSLFAGSLLLLFGLDASLSKRFRGEPQDERGVVFGISFAVAFLVAVGIGFHALAEGIEIGSLITIAPNMIEAIGGLGPGSAYVLHKALEGFVIGVFATVAKAKTPNVLILGVVCGGSTIIGSLLALVSPLNSAFFFALGGGAAIYIEFKLIPNFVGKDRPSLWVAGTLVGFYSMYFAGLLHG